MSDVLAVHMVLIFMAVSMQLGVQDVVYSVSVFGVSDEWCLSGGSVGAKSERGWLDLEHLH